MMNSLLVATGNAGKMIELRALLAGVPARLVAPEDVNVDLEVIEDGSTYSANALKKASAFAGASGLLTLADDTGLEVEALDGAPGLRSRRYLPDPVASDADRRAYLLQNLRGRPRPWFARFIAAVAIVSAQGESRCVEGECEGEIVPEERGLGGFGYDPIFLVRDTGMTMAELDLETKNRLGHRGQAVSKAIPILLEFLH